jgi:glycosyltransferase involved in cell wall biosynthesis
MTSLAPARTLYLCYFGVREPLVQTQVLPYLRQLAADGLEVYLLTFEPQFSRVWTGTKLASTRSRLAREGIRWSTRPYHKRPSGPATIFDILMGAVTAIRLARRHGIHILHARAHIALAMALLARPLTNSQVIFDVRGLMADEYVDAGRWQENSKMYRAVKWLERIGFKRADQLVVLTRRMRDWIVEQGYAGAEKIEVIPCCVDSDRFDPQHDTADDGANQAAERFELVYAGAVTGLYLLEQIGQFFLAVRALRADAFLRILTKGDVAETAATLRSVGLRDEEFWIGSVLPADVPQYLQRARLGLSLRKPTFAQIASSPTKIPEYLLAGLPVVSNAGIGDTDKLVESERVGVVLSSFDEHTLAAAAEQALALTEDPTLRARCIEVALRHFDLASIGRAGYTNVYRRILEHPSALATEQSS